jgi:small-conductance mechanosensitive channel
MNEPIDSYIATLSNGANEIVRYLSTPWTLYQIIIILACVLIGVASSRWIEPPMENWARTIKGNPGLLRILVAIMRRLNWVITIALLAGARLVLIASTWPSRSYLVSIALTLSIAWFVSAVLTRIIRSRACPPDRDGDLHLCGARRARHSRRGGGGAGRAGGQFR